jgi:hypothetical protein
MTIFLGGLGLFLLALAFLGFLAYLWDPYGDERRDARSRNQARRIR